jgi:hypothetical protein
MESYDQEDSRRKEEEEEEEEEEEIVVRQAPSAKDKRKKKSKEPDLIEALEPGSHMKYERGRTIQNMMGPMGKLHNVLG